MTTNATEPILDDATKEFVRRVIHAELVSINEIKKVVVSLMADGVRGNLFSPERLAEGLVGADLLTRWQSRKLLSGKSRGFHLGNYRLLRPLGKGGMGVVFLAKHEVMSRQMALKILPAEASRDPRRIARFKEEARASAKLEHANIVQAFDFSESDGKLFIVMEYIEGHDLHRAVAKDGVMSAAESLDAMIQTTEALVHAHQRGIIHRDIKPSNLMLRSDGVIKVSDMGLARIGYSADGNDTPNRLTGTADFIAPEQAVNSQSADARSDIYSLGCTWYFLLTGKTPYTGTSVAQRLAKHQTAKVPLVKELRSDCPPSISALIQRMMSKRAEDRPASAAELLSQMKRLSGFSDSRGELANRPVGDSTNTAFADDSSSFTASIDDSGPLREAGASMYAEPMEIDFDRLPPMEALGVPVSGPGSSPGAAPGSAPAVPLGLASGSGPAVNGQAMPQPQFQTPTSATFAGGMPNAPAAPPARQTHSQDAQQNILLGIGLAVAVLALVVVVGVTVYQLTREEKSRTQLKSTEGNGRQVIVVEN